ncbi:deoxyribonuclease V [Chloroflexota bacterium]
MAAQVDDSGNIGTLSLITGVDVSGANEKGIARAAIVMLDYPNLNVIDTVTIEAEVSFPYVPGLLSFRETPLLIKAFEKLEAVPKLVLVDGQGIAHPIRLGLASHLGLFLDIPTIGCAKSRLTGAHGELPNEAQTWTEFFNRNEVIGAAVRTKVKTNPLYISVGHKISLPKAIYWTLQCCKKYRLPEPTRLAHQAASSKP